MACGLRAPEPPFIHYQRGVLRPQEEAGGPAEALRGGGPEESRLLDSHTLAALAYTC